MVGMDWPIVPQYREDGKLVRILLHEDWYDRLLPVYKGFLWMGSGVNAVSPPTNSALDNAGELFVSLVFEFEILGWVFSWSVLCFLYATAKKAAKKVVTVGKFAYERTGFGEGGFGEGPWGESQTIIKEFPE